MATKSKFKSDVSEAIHSSAAALYKVGAIDKTTMLDFDARHLAPGEIAPGEIKQLREANNVSRRVFARYLNTNESTVELRGRVPRGGVGSGGSGAARGARLSPWRCSERAA